MIFEQFTPDAEALLTRLTLGFGDVIDCCDEVVSNNRFATFILANRDAFADYPKLDRLLNSRRWRFWK
jgi:hypothetical protein